MISYWLDEQGQYSDLDSIMAALRSYGFDVQMERRRKVWSITRHGRPWLLFNSHEEASASVSQSPSSGNLKESLRYYEQLWFVCVGDQFLYTSESELEARAFVNGLLVAHLVNGPAARGPA